MSLEEFFNSFRYKRDDLWKGFIKNRVPNFITPDFLVVSRFILAAFMCLMIYWSIDHLVLVLFFCWLFGKFLDTLDGSIARIKNKGTSYGKIIDGLSDLIVLLILAYGALLTFPLLTAIKWGIFIIILLVIIDFIRSLSKPFYDLWKPYDDLVGILFRAIISLIVLIQYLIYY